MGYNLPVSNTEAIIEELQCPTCVAREAEIAEMRKRLTLLEEQHRIAVNKLFGRSSEQTPAGQEAFVFNEAETVALPIADEPTALEVVVEQHTRKSGQRREQVANLETRDVEYPATEEQQKCPCCDEPMHFVDWQVRQEVEYIPAKAVLVNHKQPVYACRDCQGSGEATPIHTVKTMPTPAFPKSLASPSLVSHIVTQKFVMGAPLYRQEQNMEGLGVLFSRQTMANWTIRAASMMKPLYDRMHEILLTRDIVHADETSVQVLKEPDRAATTDSTMWLYRTGRDGPPVVLFEYQTTRAGKHAKAFLEGFGGYDPTTSTIVRKKYLHADGHDGYNCVPHRALIDGKETPDVILLGCWAHARRKFHDASTAVKPADRRTAKRIAADEGLKLCNDLFEPEKEFRDLTPEQRHAERQKRSAPKLGEIKTWLDKATLEVLPKTATGMAIAYCLAQWTKLTAFLSDGRLEIDNNRAERSIKPFVIGRKNWLFTNTPNGAYASATLYSIIETAKENGLIPFEYLKYLLERLPNIDPKDLATVDTLLPYSQDIPGYCRKH
jgi:transposase